MREQTKKRLSNVIREYKRIFPREYELVVLYNKQHAENQATKWGELNNADVVGREVQRMPTTLYELIRLKLSKEEVTELESDKGFLWFQRAYPEWVPNKGKE